jgi:hypothetical protein
MARQTEQPERHAELRGGGLRDAFEATDAMPVREAP